MATTFSLYGRSPTEASGQQMPWTSYFTEQSNLNERNRVASIIASLQLQEQQDRQDEYARRFDQGRAIELGDRRRVEAENTRRFNIGLASDRENAAEDRRRFGITSEISRARIPQYEEPETPAERLTAQLEMLNAQDARARYALLSAWREAKNKNPALPGDEQTASVLSPLDRELYVRSLGEKTGALDPSIRYDERAGAWVSGPPPSSPLPAMSRNPVALPSNVLAAKSEMDAVLRSRQWDSGVAKGEALDKYGKVFDDFRRNRNAEFRNRNDEASPILGAIRKTAPAPIWMPSSSATQPRAQTLTQKAQLANELSTANPDWSRQQVIETVNRSFSSPPVIRDEPPQPMRQDYQLQFPTNAPIPAITNRTVPFIAPATTNAAPVLMAATNDLAALATIPKAAPSIKAFADQIKEGVKLRQITEQEALARLAALEKGIVAAYKGGRMREAVAIKNLMDLGATKIEARTFLEDEE